jgi:hypothetical protein
MAVEGRSSACSQRALIAMTAVWALSGCAPLPPVPFDLVDKDQVSHGSFFPADRRLEVLIGDKHFEGFYIVASGTVLSQGWWPRRGFPNDTTTTFSSNSARATLSAGDDERLSCEFLLEGARAIGECRSTSGKSYQLVTQRR